MYKKLTILLIINLIFGEINRNIYASFLNSEPFGNMRQTYGRDSLNTVTYLARITSTQKLKVYYVSALSIDSSVARIKKSGVEIAFNSNFCPALWNDKQWTCYRVLYVALVTFDNEAELWQDEDKQVTIARLPATKALLLKNPSPNIYFMSLIKEKTMAYTTKQIIEKLRKIKIVPVIALDKAQDIIPLADTLANNGLPIAEITFRSVAAEEAIHLLRQAHPDFLIAAGTVLTSEHVFSAKNSGADFIITPGFNPKIVQLCQDLSFPITPGVNNPMAIEAALERGLTAVKFFPAEASGGVKMIKALLGPYAQLQIMPTGGIGAHNINDYLAIPNIVACGSSWFVEKSLINGQRWDEIGKLVQEAVGLVQ